MRGPALIAVLTVLVACEQVPSRGILVPAPASTPQTATAPVTGTAGAGATAGAGTATGNFDFEAEDRKEDGLGEVNADEIELQADLLGVDPNNLSDPTPTAAAAAAPTYHPGLPMPVWEPNQPLDGGWGLRVIATLHDVQPPRAVIATADGMELVVQPGQMLPQYRLVVLAVGHGVVQVARVTPQGFYAKVETETVASLAPAATPTR